MRLPADFGHCNLAALGKDSSLDTGAFKLPFLRPLKGAGLIGGIMFWMAG